jgi:DNA-binding LacI/PurR family transcriptional regulator
MATIRDVAKIAQVSISTVSRVLNGTAFVNDEVKKRVEEAMQELAYQPSPAARSLRVNRSRIIGLLISDIQNPFFMSIIQGVEDETHRHDYSSLLTRNGPFRKESGWQFAQELLALTAPIDALFVGNNMIAMGALNAIYARHLRIPEDIAFVGYDELPWAAPGFDELTTVAQPVYELASTAAQRLFQRLQKTAPLSRQEVILAPKLMIRASSRPKNLVL